MKTIFEYLREILTLVGEDCKKLPWLVLLFLGASILDLVGLGLIAPYIALVMQTDMVVDGLLGDFLNLLNWNTNTTDLIFWISGLLVMIFLGKAIVTLGINFIIIRFAQNQQIRLRSRLMNAYQQLPYSIYLQRNSSEYIYAVHQLAGQFQSALQQILKTVSDAIIASAIILLLIMENVFVLILLLVLIGGIGIFYSYFTRRVVKNYGIFVNQAYKKITQAIHEGIDGLKEIRILQCENYFHKVLLRNAENVAFYESRNQLIHTVPRHLLEVILIIFVVILLILTSQMSDQK